MKTRDLILKKAKQEFMTKGYEKASLRQIASRCNLTTGAIYGLFANKEELFGALVKEDLEMMQKSFLSMDRSFQENLPKRDPLSFMKEFAKLEAKEMVKIFVKYRDTIRLVAFYSQGSSYEGALNFYYLLEKQENLAFFEKMKGRKATYMEKQWIDVISESFLNGLLQIFHKRRSEGEIDEFISLQVCFYANGWDAVLREEERHE